MIETKVRNNFKTKKVQKDIQKANFTSVEHAAAVIRLTAIHSIRTGRLQNKKRIPAQAGQPPKTWSNKNRRHIKRSIRYTKGQFYGGKTLASIFASPEDSGDKIYEMHEYGGTQVVYVTRLLKSVFQRKTLGSYSAYRPLSQRSKKEQDAIKAYYDGERIEKTKISKRLTKRLARYKARPFLEPAVKKNMSRIPKIWELNIKKYLH